MDVRGSSIRQFDVSSDLNYGRLCNSSHCVLCTPQIKTAETNRYGGLSISVSTAGVNHNY